MCVCFWVVYVVGWVGVGVGGQGEGKEERGLLKRFCGIQREIDKKESMYIANKTCYRRKKKLDLKYNSPLVNSVPLLWYNDRLDRGGYPTMQPYTYFVVYI